MCHRVRFKHLSSFQTWTEALYLYMYKIVCRRKTWSWMQLLTKWLNTKFELCGRGIQTDFLKTEHFVLMRAHNPYPSETFSTKIIYEKHCEPSYTWKIFIFYFNLTETLKAIKILRILPFCVQPGYMWLPIDFFTRLHIFPWVMHYLVNWWPCVKFNLNRMDKLFENSLDPYLRCSIKWRTASEPFFGGV